MKIFTALLLTTLQLNCFAFSNNDTKSNPRIIIQCGSGGPVMELYKPEDIIIHTLSMSIDQSVIDSIEFAIQENGSREIIIAGDNLAFDLFKASKGFEDKKIGESTPNMLSFVSSIKKRYEAKIDFKIDNFEMNKMNIDGVALELISKSELVSNYLKKNELIIQKHLVSPNKRINWN